MTKSETTEYLDLFVNNCAATITNVNIRSEKHGKTDRKPAMDIDFDLNVSTNAVKGLYSDGFVDALWYGDANVDESEKNGNHKGAKFLYIEQIKLNSEFKNASVAIKTLEGFVTGLENCKVKGFSLRPRQHRCLSIKFKVQHLLENISDELLSVIQNLQKEESVQVTIEGGIFQAKDKKQVDAFEEGADGVKPEEDEELDLSNTDLLDDIDNDELPVDLADDESDNEGNE